MSIPMDVFPCSMPSNNTPPDPIHGSKTTFDLLVAYFDMIRFAISGCNRAGYKCNA